MNLENKVSAMVPKVVALCEKGPQAVKSALLSCKSAQAQWVACAALQQAADTAAGIGNSVPSLADTIIAQHKHKVLYGNQKLSERQIGVIVDDAVWHIRQSGS